MIINDVHITIILYWKEIDEDINKEQNIQSDIKYIQIGREIILVKGKHVRSNDTSYNYRTNNMEYKRLIIFTLTLRDPRTIWIIHQDKESISF